MDLTPAQKATLKTTILSDPTLIIFPNNSDGWFAIAALLNAPASPDFIVWKTLLTQDAMRAAAVNGSAEMDNLEVGKRDSLLWLIGGNVDPSFAATRTAFIDLTANRTGGFVATNLRAALTAAAKEKAKRIEKLFATGTGSDASPGTRTFVGEISTAQVGDVLAS